MLTAPHCSAWSECRDKKRIGRQGLVTGVIFIDTIRILLSGY